jgi:regulatory protein
MSLNVGQKLDAKDLDVLKSLESKTKIRDQALILLSYRQRSRSELFKRLQEKGHGQKLIESLLDEFESKGYINDSDFAKMYATHLVEKKMIGKIAVRNKFYPHNIPDHILNPIIDKLYVSNPPLEMVKSIIRKKVQMRKRTPKEKTKLVNILKRKGFVWNEIESAINNIDWNE